MNGKEALAKKLFETFEVEAKEHLQEMSLGLIALEKEENQAERTKILETVFREAHSLKGASRVVNVKSIERICQSLESLFSDWKEGKLPPNAQSFDLCHTALDQINHILMEGESSSTQAEVSGILAKLEQGKGGSVSSFPKQERTGEKEIAKGAPERGPIRETIRISTEKLNAILLQCEELIAAKVFASTRLQELREIAERVSLLSEELKGVVSGTSGKAFKKGEEGLRHCALVTETLEDFVSDCRRAAQNESHEIGLMVDRLLEDVKKASTLPFSVLLQIFPKLVRDLAREQGKEVDLEMTGEEVEIDRRILEEIKDPLIHMVRNSIDHGIEKSQERIKQGKSPQGKIRIAVGSDTGGRVEVSVSDDGRGVDYEAVHEKAMKLGYLSEDQGKTTSPKEIASLLFRSGMSTSAVVTDISGRGIGLAIVKEKVEQLGGAIAMESVPLRGTTLRLSLPIRLASFRGLLVRMGDHRFVIPSLHVERVVRITPDVHKTIENREVLALKGETIPLVSLRRLLTIPGEVPEGGEGIAVIVLQSENRVALSLDEVLSELEVLEKDLGKQLKKVRNIAGATVLGAGKVMPVLQVSDLIQSALKGAPDLRIIKKGKEAQKNVLVVEDSITTRTLLQNILESAGYLVQTAVDGADALAKLRESSFDIVVSDIAMPRMDGFELVKKIKADKDLNELPVVLVTSLESREDRERGLEAGADAYIVKSSFDQGNLLEILRRLV